MSTKRVLSQWALERDAASLIPIRTYPALSVIICGNIDYFTYLAAQIGPCQIRKCRKRARLREHEREFLLYNLAGSRLPKFVFFLKVDELVAKEERGDCNFDRFQVGVARAFGAPGWGGWLCNIILVSPRYPRWSPRHRFHVRCI